MSTSTLQTTVWGCGVWGLVPEGGHFRPRALIIANWIQLPAHVAGVCLLRHKPARRPAFTPSPSIEVPPTAPQRWTSSLEQMTAQFPPRTTSTRRRRVPPPRWYLSSRTRMTLRTQRQMPRIAYTNDDGLAFLPWSVYRCYSQPTSPEIRG